MNMKNITQKIFVFSLAAVMTLGAGASVSAAVQTDTAAATVNQQTAAFSVSAKLNANAITKGEYLKVTASADNASGDVQYRYCFKKASETKWTLVRGYSKNTTATMKPSAATTYNIRVQAKDSSGKVIVAYADATVYSGMTSTAKVSRTNLTKGQSVTVYGGAKGGSGSYQYAYYYKKSTGSKWTTAKNFSAQKSVSIKPAEAMDYNVCVKAKDTVTGKIVKSYFDLHVQPTVKNTSEVTSAVYELGSSIVLKMSATGGSGTYTYAYRYKGANETEWTGYTGSFNNTSAVKLTLGEGEYSVCAMVKDSNGYISRKYITVSSVTLSEEQSYASKIVKEIITDDMSEMQKVKAIHDWLVVNTQYDNIESIRIPDADHTAMGLFINHKAVCDGYAHAFVAMCDVAGIESNFVTGDGYGSSGSAQPHAWNQVKVDGVWYNIDVTWDDPIVNGVSPTDDSNLRYAYFLIPDEVINRDHVAYSSTKYQCTTEQPAELVELIVADTLQKNPTYCYAESVNEAAKKIMAITDEGENVVSVIYKIDYKDSTDFLNQHLKELIPRYPGVSVSTSVSYRPWKFDGYTLLTLTFDFN